MLEAQNSCTWAVKYVVQFIGSNPRPRSLGGRSAYLVLLAVADPTSNPTTKADPKHRGLERSVSDQKVRLLPSPDTGIFIQVQGGKKNKKMSEQITPADVDGDAGQL